MLNVEKIFMLPSENNCISEFYFCVLIKFLTMPQPQKQQQKYKREQGAVGVRGGETTNLPAQILCGSTKSNENL